MNHGLPLDDREVIKKRYCLRKTGQKTNSYEVTIPKEVIEREFRRLDVAPEDAVKVLSAIWRYNSFTGLHLSFEPKVV